MMFKRIVSFLSAVIVAASSAFAWDAYSFTGVYDVASSASVMILDDSSSTSSVLIPTTRERWYERFSVNPDSAYCGVTASGYIENPFLDNSISLSVKYPSSMPATVFVLPDLQYGYGFEFRTPYDISIQYDNDPTYYEVVSSPLFAPSSTGQGSETHTYLTANLNVSDFSFSSFELSGTFLLRSYLWNSSLGYFSNAYGGYLELYVNDKKVYTFYSDSSGVFDFAYFVYNATVPITSMSFRFYSKICSYTVPETGTLSFLAGIYCDNWNVQLSSLGDLGALDTDVDQAQDDINDHESMESQWTGSMSSNFDALDMDSFTFPSGLLSGFSLITGIFQDLWNGMGDYKILYVFPLFLGIALLLIGRISKFSGGQSSSRSNRGDDDA